MNKREIAAYFDRQAPLWDAHMITDDEKIRLILNTAGVARHATVLDVACGTGVLFPYYLARDVSRVIGVDISPCTCAATAAWCTTHSRILKTRRASSRALRGG